MPIDWQKQFIGLVEELTERHPGWDAGVDLYVHAKRQGKYCVMPEYLENYRTGIRFIPTKAPDST